MAYLPDGIPSPEPTIDDKPFWDHCTSRQLRFQRCCACGRFRHPPAPACQHCRSFPSEWIEAKDEAELFSFTVVHHAAHAAIDPVLPYNVAVVIFRSFGNLRLVSNIVDIKPEDIRIGMRLRLVWEQAGNGITIPRFASAAAAAATT